MKRTLILASMILSAFTGELRATAACRWVPAGAASVQPRRAYRKESHHA